jgi:predicted transcriptional regulator
LESLLRTKYFKDISPEQVYKIKNFIHLADNKKIPIKEKFEFSIDNVKRPFEIQFIPNPEISCYLIFRELEGIRSRLEGTELQLLEQGIISNDLMRILKYVFQRNTEGFKPTYGEICDYMEITSRTGRKKLRALIENDYLNEIKNGRTKNLTITEKGKMSLP